MAGKDDLKRFISQNKTVNLSTVNLGDPATISGFSWSGLEAGKAEMVKALKAYQRLARIIPGENPDIILALLEKNIHSALQIAAIPRPLFLNTYSNMFGKNTDLMERVYRNALAVRAAVVRRYL